MKEFEDISTDELKKQYIACCFGKMIYGVNIEAKRKLLSEEIQKRKKVVT